VTEMLEYEDKECPKCGSKNIEVVDYFKVELLEEFESRVPDTSGYVFRLKKKVTKVYSCEVLLGCLECNHTWSCPGTVSEEEMEDDR